MISAKIRILEPLDTIAYYAKDRWFKAGKDYPMSESGHK
jgi:hypothetical protein